MNTQFFVANLNEYFQNHGISERCAFFAFAIFFAVWLCPCAHRRKQRISSVLGKKEMEEDEWMYQLQDGKGTQQSSEALPPVG